MSVSSFIQSSKATVTLRHVHIATPLVPATCYVCCLWQHSHTYAREMFIFQIKKLNAKITLIASSIVWRWR